MHDLCLGCFPTTIEILLRKLIESGVVTLDEINGFIKDFDYGYSEITSKPAEIKLQHLEQGLHQSATEMWQLAVMLPLLIGPRMDVDSDVWNVYLCLLQVSMIIFARKFSSDMLGFLQAKLTEYAEGFLRCYRNTLKPKQHYLMHYVHYISQYGPIAPLWSMRMEARHQPFKRLAEKMRNFKNIALSLAKRNQLWEASQRFSEHFQRVDVTMCGGGVQVAAKSCAYKAVLPDDMDFVIEVPYVEANNMMLTARECCLAIDFDFENSLPTFGYLHAIIMVNDIPSLVCKAMVTVCFDANLNGYEVEVSDDFLLIAVSDLYTEAVFHWHSYHGKKFVIVKGALGPLF